MSAVYKICGFVVCKRLLQHPSSSGESTTNEAQNFPMAELPIFVDENNFELGTLEILGIVRPNWIPENIEFKRFTDGLSNKLIGCFHADSRTSKKDVVLIRIYGNNSELVVDRDAEKRNIAFLHKHGFASELYATFKNGLVYEFVPGCTLNSVTLKEPGIWSLVAKNLAKMHKLPLSVDECDKEPMLKTKANQYLDLVPDTYSNPDKQERFAASLLSKVNLREEFNDLYKVLEDTKSPIVFCHNDLILSNVIHNEESNKITFIDYEFAEANFQAFDIGSHFVGFRVIGSNNQIDYSTYPSREYQFDWIRAYLEEFTEADVTTADVETLYKHANKFALSSHFLWCVWSLIQAEHSTIDFDFISFAASKYNEYQVRKKGFLSL